MEAKMTRKRPGGLRASTVKETTSSSKKHRFEPFSQRIARMKIDPIRKPRGRMIDELDISSSTSYFRTALDNWVDLNLSGDFTRFSKQVQPLCDSLSQIIYYEDRIIELLLEYIGKGASVSLEPLLDLVAQFAHDLGVRFERHFAKAVSAVSQVASRNPDVEVIEWSFNCLTWLFKYLSKLLVPDLIPLYDIMTSLLGKDRHKAFVSLFAAESLSFLIRKASTSYHKDKGPLEKIVRHILSDVCDSSHLQTFEAYQRAIMTLFGNSIKGFNGSLSSTGCFVFQEILSCTMDMNEMDQAHSRPVLEVLQGVFASIARYSTDASLQSIIMVLLDQINVSPSNMMAPTISLSMGLITIAAGWRGGSKIKDWTAILKYIGSVIHGVDFEKESIPQQVLAEILAAFALSHQHCPLDVAITHVKLFDTISKDPWKDFFVGFCELYASLGQERFQTFLLSYFQRFLVSQWSERYEELCELIPKLARDGLALKESINLPKAWQDRIVDDFDSLYDLESEPLLPNRVFYCNNLLSLVESSTVDETIHDRINSKIINSLKRSLNEKPFESEDLKVFSFGNGLKYLMKSNMPDIQKLEMWQIACSASVSFIDRQIFWDAVARFHENGLGSLKLTSGDDQTILDSLISSLDSPSHQIRLSCLGILKSLLTDVNSPTHEILDTALSIEDTSPNMQTMRFLSMQVRKLATSYSSLPPDSPLIRAIPTFCFGLLHVHLASLWDDACAALKTICSNAMGEAIVCEIAFHWLEAAVTPHKEREGPELLSQSSEKPRGSFDEFQLLEILSISQSLWLDKKNGSVSSQRLRMAFDRAHSQTPHYTLSSRAQALKVLRFIPQYAEKRSRLLVPVLLNWVSREHVRLSDQGSEYEDQEEGTRHLNSIQQNWSRKDQKAFLSLFAMFHNPRALYKSTEVYSALLTLLEHGDVEIQKSALQAVFSWKNDRINRHEGDLLKLLDDAKLKEQISVFLAVGQGDGALENEYRADVMPIILRLLYGRVINRGRGDQQSGRRAIFGLISRFPEEDANDFLNIALGTLNHLNLVESAKLHPERIDVELLSQRKQFGLMNMLRDMLDTLKTTASSFVPRLVDPIIYCVVRATRQIDPSATMSSGTSEEVIGNPLARSIRQPGIHCLNVLFSINKTFDFDVYVEFLFHELINPRVEKLPSETSQSVSALLRLFSTWTTSTDQASYLAVYNSNLIPKISDCIGLQATRDEVKCFVLNNIFKPLINTTKDMEMDSQLRQALTVHSKHLLEQIELALHSDPSKELLEIGVDVIVALADFIALSSPELLMISIHLVQQPSKRVRPDCKSQLLKIIERSIPKTALTAELFDNVLEATCKSFALVRNHSSRTLLSEIAFRLAEKDSSLMDVAKLCKELNAYSNTRLDQPDFERRSTAFFAINEKDFLQFSSRQWQLLLGNMLYFIKDEEELAIRASAAHSIRRFVETAAQKSDEESSRWLSILQHTVLAGIQSGLRDQPELIRMEYLTTLSCILKYFPKWTPVKDLTCLLHGDDESSFFINILHIQQHRRLRALKRLTDTAKEGHLSSTNVYQLLIPLLEHFVFGTDGVMAAESVRTIGTLCESLDWPQYRMILRKYIQFIQSKLEFQETILKLLDATTIALDQANSSKSNNNANTALSKSLPSSEKLPQILIQEFLPPLLKFLEDKDESFVSRRIPVAISAARIIRLLPPDEFRLRFPPLLTDTCNILRSKDQNSRDMTRKALATICGLVGAPSIGYVVKELRQALQRGFYLHVLAFTVHSILETLIPTFELGDLDYCTPDIVAIIMDDVFGSSGQEKDISEFLKNKNTKKEVRGKKSFDSMQLLASTTSLRHLVDLVRPVEMLLLEKLNHKMMGNVDEILRRVELGILQNPSIRDREILIFSYEIIQDAYKIAEVEPRPKKLTNGNSIPLPKAGKNHLEISISRQVKIGKIVRFGLELVRGVLKKHKDLKSPANIAGFLPIIGDALVQDQDDIKFAAIRLFTSIIGVPLDRIDQDAPVYIAEAVRIIEDSQATSDELSQAALKLVAAILRERKSVSVDEDTVSILLKKLRPDLQIISHQGVAFNLLRSVISRKIVIPEVYALVDGEDGIAAISVRDHDRTTRDLARGVYFQFLMEYPQGKGRFGKQLAFLVRNLEYEFPEGRQSVMETLNLLLTKIGDEMVQQVVMESFWPVVAVMVNDDSSDCRQMASGLVRTVFNRADDEWFRNFINLIRKLLGEESTTIQKRTALQCWTTYVEVHGYQAKEIPFVLKRLHEILAQDADIEDWQVIYYSLHTLLILCKNCPKLAFSSQTQSIWKSVYLKLSFRQSWVKHEAAKLVGMMESHFASSRNDSMKPLPLSGSQNLRLAEDDLCDIAYRSLRILRNGVNEQLSSQIVRNLAFIGRCFSENSLKWRGSKPFAPLDEAEIEESSGSEQDETDYKSQELTAIEYLFRRLAQILRREPQKSQDTENLRAWRVEALIPRSAALQLIASLCNSLSVQELNSSMDIILLPLVHLTDKSITAPSSSDASFTEAYDSLVNNATELLDMLQTKMGTTAYVQALQRVKDAIMDRREARRQKRKIEAVTMPEVVERRKIKRREAGKAKRKEKGLVARGKRRGW